MAASVDEEVRVSLRAVNNTAMTLESAKQLHHEARLRFFRDARNAGWSWPRIGRALELSATAVRRYWRDHRMEVGRL